MKTLLSCKECGYESSKWLGKCPSCGLWNSFIEIKAVKSKKNNNYSGDSSGCQQLDQIQADSYEHITTNIGEFDRVLGGGVVPGSVVLLGGDPGIGKSTLLLQLSMTISKDHKVLYCSGEESAGQVKLRSERLGANIKSSLLIQTETCIDLILATIDTEQPKIVIIDSIQTMYAEDITSSSGSVSQVKECTAKIVRSAKNKQISFFIIGHVTKDGQLAGPRVLEHMVDTVLYFEGDPGSRYKMIRAVKNRFGAANELGIFAMAETGLQQVTNPSKIFLSNKSHASGSCIVILWEGTRPMLVELQALVTDTYSNVNKRVSIGIEPNRMVLVLAVIAKHSGVNFNMYDIFCNIVGGVKTLETAIDLGLAVSVISSLKNKVLPKDFAVFGEIGLTGEIRPVANGESRANEAVKQGFKQLMLPGSNTIKAPNMKLYKVNTISEVITTLEEIFVETVHA